MLRPLVLQYLLRHCVCSNIGTKVSGGENRFRLTHLLDVGVVTRVVILRLVIE